MKAVVASVQPPSQTCNGVEQLAYIHLSEYIFPFGDGVNDILYLSEVEWTLQDGEGTLDQSLYAAPGIKTGKNDDRNLGVRIAQLGKHLMTSHHGRVEH